MRSRLPISAIIHSVALAGLSTATLPAFGQESRALFDAPLVVLDEFHRFDELLDLDGDGDMDAIGSWRRTDRTVEVTAYRNDGAGPLVPTWAREFDHDSDSHRAFPILVVGDLNGDSFDDFVFLTEVSRVHCFLADGAGGFSPWREWQESASVDDIALADFDGDGLGDVALRRWAGIRIYFNDGPIEPMELAFIGASFSAKRLAVGELNGDGVADLVTWADRVRVVSAANRVLVVGDSLGVDWGGHLAVGDIDGDGDEDIVSFRETTYAVYRRIGPSAFASEVPVTGGTAVRLADVDGDGDLDGICCSGGGDGINRNDSPSMFNIAINRGGGDFAPAIQFLGLGSWRIAGAADVDADGDVDLVAGRCIYYSRGPFVDPYFRIGAVADSRVPLDVEGDGDLDWEPERAGFFANAGDGSFTGQGTPGPAAPDGSRWYGYGIPGDFDGDGDTDLVVQRRVDGAFVDYRWWWNVGGAYVDGGLACDENIGISSLSESSYAGVADVDDDGDVDLFLYSFGSPNASRLWLNDAGLSLEPGLVLTDEPIFHAVDLDGDGRKDLLTRFPGGLGLRRGLGDAAFGAPEPIAAFGQVSPKTLPQRIADLDQDGDLDILGNVGGDLWIYANDGNAVFTPALRLATDAGERSLIVDADGDGDLDVVAGPAPEARSASFVFLAEGPGFLFAPPILQVFHPGIAVDADGDGDLDILSADVTHSSTIHPRPDHLIRCRAFDGSSAGSRTQFGPKLAGTGGVAPTLGAVGPFRVGLSHEIRLVGGRGGARAFLAAGRTSGWAERRSGILLVGTPLSHREVLLSGEPGAAGEGRFVFRRAVTPPHFAGRRFVLQAAVIDPAAPQRLALSNGLEIRFGD